MLRLFTMELCPNHTDPVQRSHLKQRQVTGKEMREPSKTESDAHALV